MGLTPEFSYCLLKVGVVEDLGEVRESCLFDYGPHYADLPFPCAILTVLPLQPSSNDYLILDYISFVGRSKRLRAV